MTSVLRISPATDLIIKGQLSTKLAFYSVDPLLASASVVFGLIFGSFLNVCIYRLPRDL